MIPIPPNFKGRKKDLVGDEVIRLNTCFPLSVEEQFRLCSYFLKPLHGFFVPESWGPPGGQAVFTAVLNSHPSCPSHCSHTRATPAKRGRM